MDSLEVKQVLLCLPDKGLWHSSARGSQWRLRGVCRTQVLGWMPWRQAGHCWQNTTCLAGLLYPLSWLCLSVPSVQHLCVRLGTSLHTYRKEARFEYICGVFQPKSLVFKMFYILPASIFIPKVTV